jgi:hypothetical protein
MARNAGDSRVRRPAIVVSLLLIVGIGGSVIALKARESNAQFISAQEDLSPVSASALEELISTTKDPRPGYSGRARGAHCTSAGGGALGNPWTCLVRYQRDPRIRYRVIIHADRSILGSGQPLGKPVAGKLIVQGCCVAEAGT